MKTFDEIIPEIVNILKPQAADLAKVERLIINRDLNGRIRLLVDNAISEENKKILESIAENMARVLGNRIPETNRVLYEPFLDMIIKDTPCFTLPVFPKVIIADRLVGETNWSNVMPVAPGTHRIVFYSIKGGVGRSTALAATAWELAEEGKKVLVLDMDLESPGISSSLLPSEKSPMYGIVDWLVEDLIDNGDAIFPDIFSLSDLSRNGEIFIVPSYGKNYGEYISKIGRVWMSKQISQDVREPWQVRMNRLIQKLETRFKPDVVLIDSRAGIDEISSACITSFGAESILLFAVDTDQTWNGYRILLDHWLKTNTVKKIRERFQIVGSLIPEINSREYIDGLCEHSWDIFNDKLYDDVPSINPDVDLFSFDKGDEEAPHYPRLVMWNRGFETLPNLHQAFGKRIMQDTIKNVFGNLIDYIREIT